MTGYEKAFIDTAPFIYYIEGSIGNPEYSKKTGDFFRQSYENDKVIVTSVITLEEYKVFPYRNNQKGLIDIFEKLIKSLNIQIIDIDRRIADKAARIRAEYKTFKAMDALQLATSCLLDCDLFLTNDKQLKQFTEIKCVTMDEL